MSEVAEIITKKCNKCGIEKIENEENFRFRNGKYTECKECIKNYNKTHKKKYNQKLKENSSIREFPEEKQCTKCSIVKKLNTDNYYFHNVRKLFSSKCKQCVNEESAQKYEENLKKQGKTKTIKIKLDPNATHKNCTQCNILKNIKEEFYFNTNNNKYVTQCKECVSLNSKVRLSKPENKIKKAKGDRTYLDNNKEKVKFQRQNARKNPKNKIRHNVSSAILKSLKRKNKNKDGTVSKDLPYTTNELIKHLESLFEPWMTLDNNGIYDPKTWNDNDQTTWKWQIDHIKPVSQFKYESMKDPKFQECWALSNLRPYSAKLNVIEQDKR